MGTNTREWLGNAAMGTHIALQMSPEPTAEDLQFAQQLGVEYAVMTA